MLRYGSLPLNLNDRGTLMAEDKKRILGIVLKAAQQYHDELENKNLLFVYKTKQNTIETLEVAFLSQHFLHLTGLNIDKRLMSANKFYERCLTKRLKLNDFECNKDGSTELKLAVINLLLTKNLGAANMIGTFDNSAFYLQTDRFVGSQKGCIGFIKHKGNGQYIPNTLLKVDGRKQIKQTGRVLLTYRKNMTEDSYTECVYKRFCKDGQFQSENFDYQ